MSSIKYIRPIDQPTGTFRLLDWLNNNFSCGDYVFFRCLVAFAKIKPFYNLHESIQTWNSRGDSAEAIIGIDQKGTSYQALQYILANFNCTRILHFPYSTFHPKVYIFYGEKKASAYFGSSNLTTGGLETNFESGVIIDFDFPEDKTSFDTLLESYSTLLKQEVPCTTILTLDLLNELKKANLLLDETVRVPALETAVGAEALDATRTLTQIFNLFPVKPAKAIPKSILTSAVASAGIVLKPVAPKPTRIKHTSPHISIVAPAISITVPENNVLPIIVDGFVIQVSPHHNGEIFLSKTAIEQNRPFFGYPFSGRTTPKRPTNPSYPQRDPDPVVNIRIFDEAGSLVHTELSYNLNMVYYEKKSEIRITVTPILLKGLRLTAKGTDYPILVMSKSKADGCDYDMDFYAIGSVAYSDYLLICNQTLPSGGKPVARKMGWI